MNYIKNSINEDAGFTLIELMISLVLGMLISAAAFQVYSMNYKTKSIQQSSSDLQDASIFGMQQLENHVRLANLGNAQMHINDKTPDGGIVLSAQNLDKKSYDNVGYLTRSGNDKKSGENGWTGVSNMNNKSGSQISSNQLTIQFINETNTSMPDCEGNKIPVGTHVIERYFLRESGGQATGNLKNLVLACDAGRISKSGKISRFGDKGVAYIVGVDQFSVLLGTQGELEESKSVANPSISGNMAYMSSDNYLKIKGDRPPIVSIKIGIVIHGSTAILANADQTDFILLGVDHILKDHDKSNRSKRMRTAYEATMLLRNARVINVIS